MENNKFVHLHLHDEYSLLDGLGTANGYASKAKEMGFEAIALTNHGNVDGNIKFQDACEKAGIIPIHGCELYVVENINKKVKGDVRKHCLVIVKNEKGWQNLLRMLTIANIDGFYYRPRVSPQIILDHCEGLIFLTACSASFITESWGIKLLLELKKMNPGDVYLEIMPFNTDNQVKLNKLCVEYSTKYGLKLIATNDCHYIDENDSKVHEVLLAMQSKKKWDDKTRWKFDTDGFYLRSADEMIKAFENQSAINMDIAKNALLEARKLIDSVKEFRVQKRMVNLPKIPGFLGIPDEEILKKLCEKGFAKLILGNKNKKKLAAQYKQRYEEEMEIIIKQGFCGYFLVVWELIDWCRNNDIMVGPGRGSSGGSLVCYLLRITGVDPIEFKLLFARFISPARIDLPDIDMDFQDNKRNQISEHLKQIYGEFNVIGISTFMVMKGRGAVRDVSRVFDVPISDVNKACESIVVRSSGDFRSDYSIEDAFQVFEDGKKFLLKYPEVARIAMKLEGLSKSKGQHAAAVVLSSEDLRSGERCVLVKGSEGEILANFDKHDIEHIGLMKLDVLGLNALTVLNEARSLIKANYGVDIDFESLSLDDVAVFAEFSKGNTVGCFQFGSLGLRKLCAEMGIENFELLTHANALYRPGTLRSGMTREFVARKKGITKWDYKHPAIEKLTASTYGIILYQEQVMQFMYDLGGLGWKTADTVRKVMSKSQGVEQFQKFKALFAEGCAERKTLSKEVAEEIWDELSSFGSYGFNLSHAVEYSVISYWDMWCKIRYTKEFICAQLTYGSDNRKDEIVEEAMRLKIDIRPPKFGKSDAIKWVICDGIIYCPFIEIKGFGEKTAELAAKGVKKKKIRHGFFDLSEDFPKLIDGLSAKYIGILDKIKAFEDIECDDDFADEIAEYFQVSFCKNPARKFLGIVDFIKSHKELCSLKDVDFLKHETNYKLYFGQMTEIRFGYRTAVGKTIEEGSEKKVCSLGGVYGNFKDSEDFSMMIFDSSIYSRKKDAIEHSTGKFLLSLSNHLNKNTALNCSNAWFEDEISEGELKGLGLNLFKKTSFNSDLKDCDKCSLRSECRQPVNINYGEYNVMIIGEYPSKEDDSKNAGFLGNQWKILWKSFDKYGLKKDLFYATNIVKCYPAESKTPAVRSIRTCSKWTDEEIDGIKPFIILAFGNIPLRYFTGQESGIIAKNATTEWNNQHKCWICWCINPSSISYHQENQELFDAGIRNFVRKLKILGGEI